MAGSLENKKNCKSKNGTGRIISNRRIGRRRGKRVWVPRWYLKRCFQKIKTLKNRVEYLEHMHMEVFPPPEKTYQISHWFADGVNADEDTFSSGKELRIFLNLRDWCELQEQSFFQELLRYLDSLRIQDSSTNRSQGKD